MLRYFLYSFSRLRSPFYLLLHSYPSPTPHPRSSSHTTPKIHTLPHPPTVSHTYPPPTPRPRSSSHTSPTSHTHPYPPTVSHTYPPPTPHPRSSSHNIPISHTHPHPPTVRRAGVKIGISHTQICITGVCKKSSIYEKGCCIQPI